MREKINNKLQFAYSAIADCQSTIRAIDVKLGALLTAVFLPLGVINKIWTIFASFKSNYSNCIPDAAIFLFFALWLLIAIALIRTLVAIDNPKVHVNRSAEHSGSFYNGGEFEFQIVDTWINRKSISSKSQVTQLPIDTPKMLIF